MKHAIRRLAADLGVIGWVSFFVLVFAAAFHSHFVAPLAERAALLDRQLQRATERMSQTSDRPFSEPAAQIAAFHKFFQRSLTIDEWLVRIYAAAKASGIELRVADYQLADTRFGLDRYRINLPIKGSYLQVRLFIEKVLLEVPVMSLDQASFRRKKVNDALIDADLALTLYMPGR